jgi:hypothetical protein
MMIPEGPFIKFGPSTGVSSEPKLSARKWTIPEARSAAT